jgi:hypothetical protein
LKTSQFQSHFQQENCGEPHFIHYFRPSSGFHTGNPMSHARARAKSREQGAGSKAAEKIRQDQQDQQDVWSLGFGKQ